jgi:hypothetical protein
MRDDLLVRVVDLRGPGLDKSADPAMSAEPDELSVLLEPGQEWDLTIKDGVRDFLSSCAMDVANRGGAGLVAARRTLARRR